MSKSVYGLIGFPLGHSFSKSFFTEKFRKEGIEDAEFRNFLMKDIRELGELLEIEPDLKGFSVTIPHKQAVIPYLNDIDSFAAKIGAVNSVKVEHRKGEIWLKGYNTDMLGFIDSLKEAADISGIKRAIVLGTGGASKAVVAGLENEGIEVIRVSRKAEEGKVSYEDVSVELIASSPLIVNCTPLGMSPNTNAFPDIPYEAIASQHVLFDLVYNPAETIFLKKGKEQGARVVNGLAMLYLQAEKSWNIWNS